MSSCWEHGLKFRVAALWFLLPLAMVGALAEDAGAAHQMEFEFRVLGSDGRPVANQRAAGMWYSTDKTGGAGMKLDNWGIGRTSFGPIRPGNYEWAWLVPGTGYSPLQSVTLPAGERKAAQSVRLKSGGQVRGVVREEGTGRPVGGVLVLPYQVVPLAGALRSWWNRMVSALESYSFLPGAKIHVNALYLEGVTLAISRDGDGSFHLQNLPAGEYELILSRIEDAWRVKQDCRVEEATTNSLPDLQVPPIPEARTFGVRVRLAESPGPVIDTELKITAAQVVEPPATSIEPPAIQFKLTRTARTDGQGRAKLYPLAPRSYEITVAASLAGSRSSETRIVSLAERSIEDLEFVLHPRPASTE